MTFVLRRTAASPYAGSVCRAIRCFRQRGTWRITFEHADNQAHTADAGRFKTSNGCAYALYTHMNEDFGGTAARVEQAARAAAAIFRAAGANTAVLFTFYPLAAAIEQSFAKVVGHVDVPETLAPFPMFGLPLAIRTDNSIAWG